MLKCAGEPVPILKPFKANFTYKISVPNQPSDLEMALSVVYGDIVIESSAQEILVNNIPYLTWVEKTVKEFTPDYVQKMLRTMVISAVYGEGRYLKFLKEKNCNE